MRIAIATGLVLVSAGWASAQTSSPADAAPPAKTLTITGCVAGGSGAQPFTLANALVLPDAPKSGADSETPSPVPPPVSATPTEPAGSGTATATAGAVGTAGNATPVPAGTSGSTAKSSNVGTYSLTGTDMTPWAGKRVQIVGTFTSAKTASAGASPATAGSADASAPLEFKVQSVQGVPGPCPKP
jgi:hypothetical protein